MDATSWAIEVVFITDAVKPRVLAGRYPEREIAEQVVEHAMNLWPRTIKSCRVVESEDQPDRSVVDGQTVEYIELPYRPRRARAALWRGQ